MKNSDGFDQKIVNSKISFTANERALLKYIINNKALVAHSTISDLASERHFSPSFISKLVHKLGYVGFADFKMHLLRETEYPHHWKQFNGFEAQKLDLEKTGSLLQQTDFKPINQILREAHAIYCYGTGHSLLNALRELSRSLMYLVSIPVIYLAGKSEFDAVLKQITANDCLIVASNSGENLDLLKSVKLLRLRNVPILSFSIFSDNTLAKLSDFSVYYYATPIPNPTGGEAIVSLLPLYYCIDYFVRNYADFISEKAH
ncbi:MurR/RpiR family transcriptional regulator [Schleiferilactobacillus harbinensis]|uniref:MurR/RpiR family transcriptional regulator n=1 Tax=Schleiferilactobacillus harbinensis TaxID=304207 RepID=A0ABU7T3D8_9LACO